MAKAGDLVTAKTMPGEDERARTVEGVLDVKVVTTLGYTQYTVGGFPVDKKTIRPAKRSGTLGKMFRHRGLVQ